MTRDNVKGGGSSEISFWTYITFKTVNYVV